MSDTPPATFTALETRTLLGVVTEDEFGRAIGVGAPTISFWRNRGEGPPFFRFKRNIFYRTADIVQWIIENTWDPDTGELVVPRFPEHRPKPRIKSTLPLEEPGDAFADRAPSAV